LTGLQHAGSKDEYASKLNAETERQIAEITKAAATKGEEVIRMLLDSVTEVYTEVTTTSSGDKILA
jgi:methanogenic corrinoid protein MtbC1